MFSCTKTSKREKIDYFGFLKKIQIVLITSFTILMTCTLINSPIENLFAHTYVHDNPQDFFR